MIVIIDFYAPLEKGGILFCNCRSVGLSVGRSVCPSVCRPSVVRSISFDPFIWSIPNLVQGLPSMSRWSLLIFWSHIQRSRLNHSFEPSVLSTLYILISCLLATTEKISWILHHWNIYVSETFLDLYWY